MINSEYKGLSGTIYLTNQLLVIKELADALRKSRRYVMYMKASGFMMPGGTATIAEARSWLARNPLPCPKSTMHSRAILHKAAHP